MRTIRLSVAVLLIAFCVGCGKKDSAAPTTKDSKKDVLIIPSILTSAKSDGDAALKAAAEFLKAIQAGQANSAMLTPAFKKVIAPAELEADKAAGYSESGVQAWWIAAKTATLGELKSNSTTADSAFATAGKTYVRLVRSDKIWLVDYVVFWNSGGSFTLPGNDSAPSYFAGIALADAIASKNFAAWEALLTASLKGKLAPPLFDTDKTQGYNRSKLQSVFSEFITAKFQLMDFGETGTPGEMQLQFHDGPNRFFKHTLKLVPGTKPGEYLIDDILRK